VLPQIADPDAQAQRQARFQGLIGLGFVAALSFIAGMTDAIGFMATGDFVSFMSGNTTRLAVALYQDSLTRSAHIALLVLVFILGNVIGVLAAKCFDRRPWPLLLSIGSLLMACGYWGANPAMVLLAVIAMGMINAVVEEVNGLPIGLTYVTGALSRFGRGLGRWLTGERRSGWRVQLIPWCGMLAGGIAGGILADLMNLEAMLVSGLVTVALGIVSLKMPRNWRFHPRAE